MKHLWMLVLLLGAAQQPPRDRSPGDLALSADGRWALSANRTSDSVSLVDLSGGRLVAEIGVGRRPFGIAWRGAVAAVANWQDGTLTGLGAAPPELMVRATIPVGNEPRGVVLDGARAYVGVSGDDPVD